MNVVDVIPGDSPIVLAQPHGGTFVPDDIMKRLNQRGQVLADTDWHIMQLYEGLLSDATVVRSNVHRYVIDANRDPEGASLYPDQNTTTLCPTTDFDGHSIWVSSQEPTADEIESRHAKYHAPYHSALAAELERVRAQHGMAVLFDCHSIRSRIPFLFNGLLPVFNIGTNSGTSCAEMFEKDVHSHCHTAGGFDTVLNGRFKGGWTTRHYGRPNMGVHAIQMELAQRAYMDEAAPWAFRSDRAAQVRPVLAGVLESLEKLARSDALFT